MKLTRLSIVLALFVSLLVAAPRARAGEIEEALPETTVFLLKVSDWTKTGKDLDGTALGKILAEEDVKEYLKGLSKVMTQMVNRLEKETGIKKEDFRKAYGTEITVAFLGMEKLPTGKVERKIKVNQAFAVGSLHVYCEAQAMFKRNDWDGNGVLEYAPDFSKLHSTKDGAAGLPIDLIDAAFAAAKGPKGTPKHGYVFHDMKTIAGKKINWVDDHGLCAVPAKPGKSGKLTFIINTNGTVFSKDTKGKPVLDYPNDPVKAGWKIAVAGSTATPPPPMSVGILAKVGDADAAGRVNATIRKMATKIPGEVKPFTWGKIKGTRISKDKLSLYIFRAGNHQAWFFASGGGVKQVKELAAALAGAKREKSLATSADYRLCRGKLGGRADVFWYLGFKKGLEQGMSQAPEKERADAEKILKALGVRDFIAAAGTLSVEAPGFRSRAFMACKLGEEGILGLVGAEPLPAEFLRIVPPKVVTMQAGSLRIDRFMPLLRKVLASADEGKALKEMEKGLAEFKKQLGFDLEKDVIGALGNRACMYVLPAGAVGGNPLMSSVNGLAIVVEVKDAAALRKATAKMTELSKAALAETLAGREGGVAGAPQPVTTFEYRGQTVTAFNIANMAAPGYAITDKYLIIGGNVQTVKRALARLAKGKDAPAGLTESDAYKKAVARLKTEGACGIGFVDTATTVQTGMAGMGMVMGLMGPAISAARYRVGGVRRAVASANLRQIGLAIHMYADDNDEIFPKKDLGVLMPNYIDNKKVLLCPGYGKHAADGIDYAYVAGLKAIDPGTFIMAYESVPDKAGKRLAVFCDAHVESLSKKTFDRIWAEQTAKLKKQGRKVTLVEPKGVARAADAPFGDAELSEETFFKLIEQLTNPATMPPPDAVTKHLFPGVSVTRKVPGGVFHESFTPLGFGGGLGGGGGSPQNLATVSIVAAIAIPSLLAARRTSLETNAVGSCRAYAAAQTMFHRNDWDGNGVLEYAPDFTALYSTKDAAKTPIDLIDAAFAAARGPKGPPKHGYVFYNMKTIGGKKINWVDDFALCAVPAVYRRTGYRTFIINTNGTVFGMDTGGNKPVFDYPANLVAAGWIIAE